jgi:hypothetical protein
VQTQYGEAAENAILAAERSFRARLRVDWNQDGNYTHPLSNMDRFVNSVETDRGLTGSAPEELLLIEGSAAAEMTVQLSGDYSGRQLSAIFSPYNSFSPLYGNPMVGAEVKYELGIETNFGTFWYSQFVGFVRLITPSRADSGVEISCLDRAELLRRPILFPTWAISEHKQNCTANVQSQLTNSSWVIDHCLRHCDVSPSPWRPTFRSDINDLDFSFDGTQLFVPGTDSFLPVVGWPNKPSLNRYVQIEDTGLVAFERQGVAHPDNPEPTQLPFNMANTGIETETFQSFWYNVADLDSIDPAGLHFVSFTMILRGQNATDWQDVTNDFSVLMWLNGRFQIIVKTGDSGKIWSEMRQIIDDDGNTTETGKLTTNKLTIPTDRDYCRVNIVWDNNNSTGIRALVTLDELTTGIVRYKVGNWWGSDTSDYLSSFSDGQILIQPPWGMQDFSYSTRARGTTLEVGHNAGVPARYAASLDTGLQDLTFLPTKRGDDAWSIITEAAGAEFGSVFWDESGHFRFWEYQRMLDLQGTTVRTYTMDDLNELRITNTIDSVRNIWTIDAKRKVTVFDKIYESKSVDEFFTPDGEPDGSKDFTVRIDDVVSAYEALLTPCTGSEARCGNDDLRLWSDKIEHGYVAQFNKGDEESPNWEEDDSEWTNIEVKAFFDPNGDVTVRVQNDSDWPVRFAVTPTTADVNDTTGDYTDRPQDPSPTAQPALRIAGDHVIDYGNQLLEVKSIPSIVLYREKNLKFSGDWIQDSVDLTAMQDVLMPRMLKPVPTTDDITVAGDPRIQMGDTIVVDDIYGFGQGIKLQVYGIKRTFSVDDGLTDVLTVEMIQPIPLDVDPSETPTVLRRNLCPNPCAEVADTGWVAEDSDLVAVTDLPRNYGFKAEVNDDEVEAPRGDVTAGETYRFSAWIKATNGSVHGKCHIHWYNSGGSYIDDTADVSWSVSNGGVLRIDSGPREAPVGATKATLSIFNNNRRYTVTAVLYEETSDLLEYFDGYSQFASWEGAPGLSTSVITEAVIEEPPPEEPPVFDAPPDGSLDPPA